MECLQSTDMRYFGGLKRFQKRGFKMAKQFLIVGAILTFAASLQSAFSADQAAEKTTPPSGQTTTHPTDRIQRNNISSPWEDFKKPSYAQLKRRLNAMQFKVTQQHGTEPAFKNKYWNNHEPGIYVDVVSGEPLFSSTDKFDSGTGWPSFVQPLESQFIEYREDRRQSEFRIEVRSKLADSHLGHVFGDGPHDRGGRRYCMNSAALRFVPKAEMEAEGYGKYLPDLSEADH